MNLHVTIVGKGRVGGAIHRRCIERGLHVTVVERQAFETWCSESAPIGDVLIIATKDAVLPMVVERIVATRAHDLKGVLVLHLNGSASVDVLSPFHGVGAITSAAHPFQTFSNDDPTALDSIAWGVQCDERAWHGTRELVEMLGGVPWLLTDMSHDRKRRYHAAAVAASNFTYAAYELARRLAVDADIPADVFLIPIMKRTLENASDSLKSQTAFSVTGPLARGDVAGVRRQLESVPANDRDLYRHLSLALLHVVADTLDEQTVISLRRVLS